MTYRLRGYVEFTFEIEWSDSSPDQDGFEKLIQLFQEPEVQNMTLLPMAMGGPVFDAMDPETQQSNTHVVRFAGYAMVLEYQIAHLTRRLSEIFPKPPTG